MGEKCNEIMQTLRPRAKTYNILIYQTGKCSIIIVVPDSESETMGKAREWKRERIELLFS